MLKRRLWEARSRLRNMGLTTKLEELLKVAGSIVVE
jgi:hypothetical protein